MEVCFVVAYMRKKYILFLAFVLARYCMMTIRPYIGKHTYITSRLELAFVLNMMGR